jgi:hypothetical protein
MKQLILSGIIALLMAGCVNQRAQSDRLNSYISSSIALRDQQRDLDMMHYHPGLAIAEKTIQKNDTDLKSTDVWELCNAYYYLTWEKQDPQLKAKFEKIIKDKKGLTPSEWAVMDKSLPALIGKSNNALICRIGMPFQVNTLSAARQSEQHVYILGRGPESFYVYLTRGRVSDVNGYGY